MSTPFDDLVIPKVVSDLVAATISQRSPFIGSGAAALDVQEVPFGGLFHTRARWLEDNAHDVVIDGTSHDPTALGMSGDVSPVVRRVRSRRTFDGTAAAVGANLLSADPPNPEVIGQTADYWTREIDGALTASLGALFDAAAGALRLTHLRNVSVASGTAVPISYGAVVKAAALVGDAVTDMSLLVCHSQQWADLCLEVGAKATFLTLGGALVPTLGNLRVYLSDGVPTSGSGTFKTYTAFIVRPGALYVAIQQALKEFVAAVPSIPAWDVGQSMHFSPGVTGASWAVTTTNPANAALATATNWAKSPGAIDRTIGIVALRTNASA